MKTKSETISSVEICARIRHAAAEQGVGRGELAKRAEVSDRIVYLTMQGRAKLRDSTVGKFARALKVDVDSLLYGATAPAVVRESKVTYPEAGEHRQAQPASLREAIRIIAEQLQVPEERVAEKIAELFAEATRKDMKP